MGEPGEDQESSGQVGEEASGEDKRDKAMFQRGNGVESSDSTAGGHKREQS